MASTCSIYRFGAVPSLESLATENMGRMTVSIFAHRRQLEAHNFERINTSTNDYQMFHLG